MCGCNVGWKMIKNSNPTYLFSHFLVVLVGWTRWQIEHVLGDLFFGISLFNIPHIHTENYIGRKRGTGKREQGTGNEEWNEEWEWGMGSGEWRTRIEEWGTGNELSQRENEKNIGKKNPAYFPVQSVTSSPIACFVPITSFSPFLAFVSRYFGDFSKDPKLAGTHHLKDKNIDSFSPFWSWFSKRYHSYL